ncbi:MAG: mannonate dehydratase [Rhodothermaceae bacterium]
MIQTWRWYGPKDPVSLNDIRQAGATGIVTALHEVAIGEVWTIEEIEKRKEIIEWDNSGETPKKRGLTWDVIESIPLHEDIKLGKPSRDEWIEKYKESLRNVGKVGIETVCYNFMPVVDWTRTNLEMELEDGAKTLAFDMAEFIAFDVFILQRENSEKDYSEELIAKAKEKFEVMSDETKIKLQKNIIAGLPGGQEGYSIDAFKARLDEYKGMTPEQYRENLAYFLKAVIPVAEEAGVKMAIHPDDPPIPLFGLPRVVSTENDVEFLLNTCDSIYNGFTLCAGSFGVRADNDLAGMVQRHGRKLNFAHLRSTQRFDDNCFHEAGHMLGNVDMFNLVLAILKEQKERKSAGREDARIPMRADHGHVILDDLNKVTNPGYSAIGRLKGLAELRGLEIGIVKSGIL